VTKVDWIALAFVGLMALVGLRRGLVFGALSTTGLVAGVLLGARLAPSFLSGGSRSPYTPVAALAGAALGAIVLETVGSLVGSFLRRGIRIGPLRLLDAAGGFALGAASGLAIVWVLGAVALNLPGQRELRQGAQRSLVLQRLNEIVPPGELMSALSRVDPFPAIAGPAAPVAPPDPSVTRDPAVRRVSESLVRVLGTACGLGVVGSGWVARPGIVVTAAHVVAGQDDTTVQPQGSGERLDAEAIAFDARNDVAVLRVSGLDRRPLALVEPRPGEPVAILGYPLNRPLTATAGRIGQTTTVLSRDAYGQGRVLRTITTLRGLVRHGNSGGPAVDRRGRVAATVFASRVGAEGGYGVPASIVRRALGQGRVPVSTGDCTR